MIILGCKSLVNVVMPDNRTEREKLFTHRPIDTYRLHNRDLPLLEGATRAYVHKKGDWYIEGTAKSYPLTIVGNEYEPYALDIEHTFKLAIYLKDDSLPAPIYNTMKALLQKEQREVWLVDEREHGKEYQYYLYRVEPVEPFSLTLLQFLPIVEDDIERDTDDQLLEHGVNITLIRTNPIVA